MINREKLDIILKAYKDYFPTLWKDEIFKWEAIKQFQDNWDIQAQDFATMFWTATEKTNTLLTNMNNFPRAMIRDMANADTEAVRGMFIDLYDESKDLAERISRFRTKAEDIRLKYGADIWKSTYQRESAISVYLWLRYPDKYFIYKYSEIRAIAIEIENDFIPRKGDSLANVVNSMNLCKEISNIILDDTECSKLLSEARTDSCYADPYRVTMTFDFIFYVSKVYNKQKETVWYPSDYSPNLSVEEWKELLADKEVFTDESLQIVKRFLDFGGEATCSQLANKYGRTVNFYNKGASALAKRVHEKTNCPLLILDDGHNEYWTVLFVGRTADAKEKGVWVWKLRDELREALEQTDLSAVTLYEEGDLEDMSQDKQYWWLNANPSIWSCSDLAVGEEQEYTLYNENGNKRRIFQNFLDVKEGDIVIGYESTPVKKIVALAEITEENDGQKIVFKKTEGLTHPIEYSVLKECPELAQMEYFLNPQGSLFKLTKAEYECIMDVIREENGGRANSNVYRTYKKEDFLREVYMGQEKYETLVGLLRNKKNLILQGAPGVGKTFAAKRLAYSMMGEIDESRVEFIQFHQNYSYEDFIMGYKPYEEGFKLTNGIFYQFCMNAANHPDKEYFFIIDEINRGNMSKIFGELLMLIEKDYRGTKATLAYSGTQFSVPKNLYIIGMMNTADRSLAMIDYALRRRFSFYEMEPGFSSNGFKNYQKSLQNETFDYLIEQICNLNEEIYADDSLGAGFRVGHSYFCGQSECSDAWMRSVVEYDILPMLKEYWFDDRQKVAKWENLLRGVFND